MTEPRIAATVILVPVQLSRAIAWRTAALQGSLTRRLGENDAWIAATALSYDATLVAREKAFERVPRLEYLAFWAGTILVRPMLQPMAILSKETRRLGKALSTGRNRR